MATEEVSSAGIGCQSRRPSGTTTPEKAGGRAANARRESGHRDGRIPTTLAGVELVLAGAVLGFRILNLAQAAVSSPNGLRAATRPTIDAVLLGTFLAEGIWLIAVTARQRSFRDARVVLADLLIGTALLGATVAFTDPSQRFTNWTDWGYPVTISVAFACGVGFGRWWQAVLAPLLLGGTYLATTLGHPEVSYAAWNAVTNVLTYPAAALIGWLLSWFLRRLGADAHHSRTRAAQLAVELERSRQRTLLHSHATTLELASRDDLDEDTQRLIRQRAASGSASIRQFLRDGPVVAPGGLGDKLAVLAEEFTDLPLTANLTSARHRLPPRDTEVVLDAARTLLNNVRWHADADSVVLHAVTDAAGGWEVTVTDDGLGFDPATTPRGYGLGTQLAAALQRIAAQSRIQSRPGDGTTVTMTGTARPAGRPGRGPTSAS